MQRPNRSTLVFVLPTLFLVAGGCFGGTEGTPAGEEDPDRTSQDPRGDSCPEIPPGPLANTTTTYEGTVWVTVAEIMWKWEYEGDTRFPVDCDTLSIDFKVEWDDRVVDEISVYMHCVAEGPVAIGASPLEHHIDGSDIVFPSDCRLGISPNANVAGMMHLSPRWEFQWEATLEQADETLGSPGNATQQ